MFVKMLFSVLNPACCQWHFMYNIMWYIQHAFPIYSHRTAKRSLDMGENNGYSMVS